MAPALPTVFIVDDDEAVRNAVSLLCEANGFKAQAYASAQIFLNNYSPSQPGCLVLDLRMPGMSGLELQTQLAADGISLPIIVVTGHGSDRDIEHARRAGAIDVIEKPFDSQKLIKLIRQLMAPSATK